MVIGESGSGRSTFINTLCDQLIVEPSITATMYTPEELSNPDRELQLRKSSVELEDSEGIKINLNIIDTPGFGESMDNNLAFKVIKDYVKYQFDEILVEESRLRRNPRFKDGRIHACLYMITPTGHGLKEMDVEIMRRLGDYVNILPCISKTDSLTVDELKLNKKLIQEDIERFRLPIFDFNNEYFTFDDNLDNESLELNKYLQSSMPFALMGSNATLQDPTTGELKRVRKYPWGTVDIFENELSDFLSLKNTLLITHLNDFKDFTHEVLYENYRTKTLGEIDNHDALDDYTVDEQAPKILSVNGADPEDYSNDSRKASHVDTEILAKEEQIRLEEERLKAFEERVQRDLLLKKEEIESRERELAEIERRLAEQSISD